jgi:hypothetical protein
MSLKLQVTNSLLPAPAHRHVNLFVDSSGHLAVMDSTGRTTYLVTTSTLPLPGAYQPAGIDAVPVTYDSIYNTPSEVTPLNEITDAPSEGVPTLWDHLRDDL